MKRFGLVIFFLIVTVGILAIVTNSTKIQKFYYEKFQNVSTDELIRLDYEKGLISLEKKWLYIMYAIFEYDKLPIKYASNVAWSATMLLKEFSDLTASGEICNFSLDTRLEIARVSNRTINCEVIRIPAQ